MRAYQRQYLDLLSAKRRSAELPADPGGPQAFHEAIRTTALRSREVVEQGTRLLREELFPVLDDLPSASAEELACLREFADQLMVGTAQKDVGLAYRIHSALMDHARRTGDRDMLIRELYWVGMSLYNLETTLAPTHIRLYTTRMRMCFTESASYFETDYDKITDPEIRGYIHRSMGNIALGYPSSDPASAQAKLAAMKRSIALLTDPEIRAKTPSLPWDRYLYMSHQERTTLLSYLRSGNAAPDVFAQVLESAQYIQQRQVRQARERGEPLQPRWQYAYFAALYHCGAMTLDELLDALYALSTAEPEDSYTVQSLFSHASIPGMYMEYIRTQKVPFTDSHADRVDVMVRRMLRWMIRVPNDDNGEQFLFYLRQTLYDYVETPGRMSFFDLVQDVFAIRYPTGYARLWRAGKIARALCGWAAEDCPERLAGHPGCPDAEAVRAGREELVDFAETAGRLYDVGMVHFFNIVTSFCRGPFEDEYSLLQLHSYCGHDLLKNHPSTALYADIAYGHHCYYNEKGGYPVSFSPSSSPVRAMIYIIAVADAISAGTDDAGRLYGTGKTLEQVYAELQANAGTQYAPFVVELLSAPERRAWLEKSLVRWSAESYADLYHRRMALQE